MTAVDRRSVEKNWGSRGFRGGLWVDPPGQVWADFVHDVDELVMLVEGRIELEFAGRVVCPSIGDEVLIPARTGHTVRNVGGTTARWLYAYKSATG